MLTIKSIVFLKKLQRFFSVLETACQAGHAAPPSPYPQQWVYLPPIQRLAAGGDFTLKVSVSICRLRRPENAVPTAGAKGGKGTVWFPCPLLTPPKPSFAPRLPSVARRNGGTGGSVPGVGSLMGRCYALNLLCVIRRAISARPFGAGRKRRRCDRQTGGRHVPDAKRAQICICALSGDVNFTRSLAAGYRRPCVREPAAALPDGRWR